MGIIFSQLTSKSTTILIINNQNNYDVIQTHHNAGLFSYVDWLMTVADAVIVMATTMMMS